MTLFAEITDSLSGSGWTGAGLLGAVLAWLLFRHLPAKDAQVKELIERHDATLKDARIEFRGALETVVSHCEREMAKRDDGIEKLNAAVERLADATRAGRLSLGAYYTGTLQPGLVIDAMSGQDYACVGFGGTPSPGRPATFNSDPAYGLNALLVSRTIAGGIGSPGSGNCTSAQFYVSPVYGFQCIVADISGTGGTFAFRNGFNAEYGSPGAFKASALTFDTNGGLSTFTGPVKTLSTTVASLPSAATAGAGGRAFVTDATATTFLSTVAGGGANAVPVVSDGTNWKIG